MADTISNLLFNRTRPRRRQLPAALNALIGLIALAALFEALGWMMRDQSFLFNELRLSIMIVQVSVIGILAIGVTQVIVTGGIDLSGGSVVGAAAMVAMSLAQSSEYSRAMYAELGWVDLPLVIPVAAGLAVGILCGLTNGVLVAYTKIPPFVATLGMMVAARGFAKWYTKGQPISYPTESFAAIGEGMMPAVIFLAVMVLFLLVLRYTVYGKHTYAIGSNEAAARMSGIKVERHLVLVYAIAGALSGLAGIVLASRTLTAQSSMGQMMELDAIAMAVIGGVSLAGGRGSVVGTAIGMLIIGVIISGFIFLSVNAYYQEMVKGAIIVGAVVLDVWRQKRRALEG